MTPFHDLDDYIALPRLSPGPALTCRQPVKAQQHPPTGQRGSFKKAPSSYTRLDVRHIDIRFVCLFLFFREK